MKSKIQKIAAVTSAFSLMAMFLIPSASAESKPGYESRVLLENQYDAEVDWNNGAVFLKNGSPDSITDQTELELVKPDGSLSVLANTQHFDQIDTSLSASKTNPYSIDSSYLIVVKDGKKALLKDDGTLIGDAFFEDISAAVADFIAVKKGDQYVVQTLDGTAVAEYDHPVKLAETDNSIVVISDSKVIDLFDKSGKKIDLPSYDSITYRSTDGNYLETVNNNLHGLISDTGKEMVPPAFNYVSPSTYKGATYLNALTYGSYTTKNTIYKSDGTVFLTTSDFFLSDSTVEDSGGYIPFYKDGGFGVYDLNTGTVKVEPIYNYILDCDSHCFAYQFNTKFGVKTYDDVDIVPPGEFQDADIGCHIGDNRVLVVLPEKLTAYIYASDTGELIKKVENYTDVQPLGGGLMTVIVTREQDTLSFTYGILDNNGNEIFPPDTYDTLYPCNNINNICLVSKNGKVGISEINGLRITDIDYQSLGGCSADNLDAVPFLFTRTAKQLESRFLCTKQNDKFGLLEIAPITYATGLSLDKTNASLEVGDTLTLTPTVSPADTTNQKITWSSSDESVATVKDGVVTALKAGTATITAKTEDGGFTASCSVSVTEKSTTDTTDTTGTGSTTGSPNSGTSPTGNVTDSTTPSSTAATESPSTGETSLPFSVVSLLAVSALTAVTARKKKA